MVRRRATGVLASVVTAAITVVLVLVHLTGSAAERRLGLDNLRTATLRSALRGVGDDRPNIVFVLTDDLSKNLVQYMPNVLALERAGMSFTNYTVDDSLCCPSRASILTGQFPHDTKVFSNGGNDGGFRMFYRRGEESSTFATALHTAGYRTALLGKYLNGYLPNVAYDRSGNPLTAGQNRLHLAWVPPGWTTWDVAGPGYAEYRYNLNQNHRVVWYGSAPSDYGVHVLDRLGSQFIATSAKAHTPFMLEVATFAPHKPYTPAPRDARSFPGLTAPRGPAFDTTPLHAPAWLARDRRLTPAAIAALNRAFRLRVQAVQSVDRMIGDLERELTRTGQASNTVFIFSSDNGLHLGEYRLKPGKLTAFDTDINVPLVVAGPHIAAGSVSPAVVQNIDLAPTFESIAGVRSPPSVDGRSIVPLFAGSPVADWRRAALIEHHGLDFPSGDPDFQSPDAGNPPTYAAIRTARFTYVRYIDGQREYYDRTRDPFEIDNIYQTLPRATVAKLNAQLRALQACHGHAECWRAAQGR